jgi:hypothetical protein
MEPYYRFVNVNSSESIGSTTVPLPQILPNVHHRVAPTIAPVVVAVLLHL